MRRLLILIILYLFFSSPRPVLAAQAPHPLRPQPNKLSIEEAKRPYIDPTQTLYCIQRPTAVDTQEFDKRDPNLRLQISGTLVSDFTEFTTPLLSITNKDMPDFNDDFDTQAKKFLADYLGGRAYYETQAENSTDPLLVLRYGVFRKLAPISLQDRYKRAMILRAQGGGSWSLFEDYYGFTPASKTVFRYAYLYKFPVACWSRGQVVNFTITDDGYTCRGDKITLNSFSENTWAPLPEEYSSNYEYLQAYQQWKAKDNGKWVEIWNYVPMFSREDTTGYILPQHPDADLVSVKHPHLARTYELASALNTLLLPGNEADFRHSQSFSEVWHSIPWCELDDPSCDELWIDSSDTYPTDPYRPGSAPVCDSLNTLISSGGDQAYDSYFSVAVNSPEQIVPNPQYNGGSSSCLKKVFNRDEGIWELKDTNCKFKEAVRYSPDYYTSYTPFLNQIYNRLSGPDGVFNIFRTQQDIAANPPEDWPGVSLASYPSASYGFTSDSAEAGMKKSPLLVKYFYKGLGYIHCQKEKILASLSPEGAYQPYSPDCPVDIINISNVCSGELMKELNPPTQTTTKASAYFSSRQGFLTAFLSNIYAKVEAKTGVPCEVLFGIHLRESDNLTGSLISGRAIGEAEPDAGNQKFDSIEATAFYAAESLKRTVGLKPVNQPDQNFKDLKTLTTALALYNGLGNSNCRASYACASAQSSPTCDMDCRAQCNSENPDHVDEFVYPIPSLGFCPPKFTGDDSNYAVNQLDNQHDPMYILFCQDHTMCQPQTDPRPGALPLAIEFYNNLTK